MMNTSAGSDGMDDLDIKIPDRLGVLRASLGLSATELDRLSGFGPGTVGRLERGEQRVYVSHLYHIASATGIPIDYFYSEGHLPPNPSATAIEHEAQRLLDVYLKVSNPTLRHDISALVESMADEYEATQPKKKDD